MERHVEVTMFIEMYGKQQLEKYWIVKENEITRDRDSRSKKKRQRDDRTCT